MQDNAPHAQNHLSVNWRIRRD